MKKQKIIIVFNGSIYSQMGFFNAVLNRTKCFAEKSNYDCDVILLSDYEPWYVRKLRGTEKKGCPSTAVIDGVKLTIDWRRFYLFDYILEVIFHKKPIFKSLYYRNFWKRLSGYDFVIAHSMTAGKIAMDAKLQLGIPFSVTWHGSDIHTEPFVNPTAMEIVKKIIKMADINVFVSDSLKNTSDKICGEGKKIVLYNGADERFYKYDSSKRKCLKEKFGVTGKKVVAFVGGFVEVKNVLVIPDIFRYIYEKEKNVQFWMLGDGKFMKQIKESSSDLPITLWGNRLPEEIPDFLNCTNVQILPSLNEGLPLTMVEALRCGCHAVGSNVGGIPEVIGAENCISLDDPDYVRHFADRVLYFLREGCDDIQEAAPCFDWNQTALKERDYFSNILG